MAMHPAFRTASIACRRVRGLRLHLRVALRLPLPTATMHRVALSLALLPVALVAGALSTRDAVAQTNTVTGASAPAAPGNAASPADAEVSRLAALPVAAQAQWLSHACRRFKPTPSSGF